MVNLTKILCSGVLGLSLLVSSCGDSNTNPKPTEVPKEPEYVDATIIDEEIMPDSYSIQFQTSKGIYTAQVLNGRNEWERPISALSLAIKPSTRLMVKRGALGRIDKFSPNDKVGKLYTNEFYIDNQDKKAEKDLF